MCNGVLSAEIAVEKVIISSAGQILLEDIEHSKEVKMMKSLLVRITQHTVCKNINILDEE